ncbi:MAG TPA: ABC transporter transmembrane domain-containing protein, partial [Candidatus Dormibacteraeota bacterium]|nr:ABC transporter transmembrane domain-containing protein [Candidatus Dormibacteraeota bacterium]
MNDGNRALSERGAERAARGSARRAYRRLLGYLAPYRGRFVLGLLGGALFSASMVSFAYFMTRFGDGTLVQQDPRTIVWVPVALVGLFLVRGLGDFTQTYFMGFVGRHIVSELRAEVFRHVLRLPVGYFDRSSSGNLLSRLTYNSELVGQATTDSVSMLLRTALTIIGSVAYLLYLNVRLALIALMVGPLMGWLVSVINRLFRRYSRRIQDSMGDVTRVAKESFEAPRLIKLYNAEDHLGRQFDAVNTHNLRSNMKLILTRGVSNPVVQMLAALGGALDGRIGHVAAEGDVVADAVVEQHHVLAHHRDLFAQVGEVVVADVTTIDAHAAGADVVEARQQVDERRLAAARASDDRQGLAGGHLERDVRERRRAAARRQRTVLRLGAGRIGERHLLEAHRPACPRGAERAARRVDRLVEHLEQALAGGDALLQGPGHPDQVAQRLRDADQRGDEAEQLTHAHALVDRVVDRDREHEGAADRGHL